MTSARAVSVKRLIAALTICLSGAGISSLAQGEAPAAPSAERQHVVIGYVDVANDPRYEAVTGYGRIVLKTREHPLPGAQIGIDEAQPLVRLLNTDFSIERTTAAAVDQVASAVQRAAVEKNIRFFIVDAPAEAFKALATAVRGRDILVFNVTASDDWLRRELCAAEIVHTLPSLAMTMDGLMQYLVSRKWRDILVLEGPDRSDAVKAAALEQSAKKFGARIAGHRTFKPGNDPREREQNNPALLSAINHDYDVVFVADAAFDFIRQVPYRTVRPRPLVGDIDLEPLAWHWTWEHNGAPQVNSRFQRLTGGRHMENADWAAWIAVKMIVQATLRTRSNDFKQQREFILGDATFDGDKGLAVSVRPWDHQLRQAILLATPYAVVASAPVEGFLHRSNDLDTLGDDEPDTSCHLNR